MIIGENIAAVLIFHQGFELPAFAAFDLLKDEAGTEALRAYEQLPHLNVLGGCCGTDHLHVTEFCSACLALDADSSEQE